MFVCCIDIFSVENITLCSVKKDSYASLKICYFVLTLLSLGKLQDYLCLFLKEVQASLWEKVSILLLWVFIFWKVNTTYGTLALGEFWGFVVFFSFVGVWRTNCNYCQYLVVLVFFLIPNWLFLFLQLCSVWWSLQVFKGPGQRPMHPYYRREWSWENR